jgi:hypothetical protein
MLSIFHEGFWLSFLDAADMGAITVRNYEKSRTFNGTEHNQSGLCPWETQTIERFFPQHSRILVAASGGGRELVALNGMGFEVDGFDCTPSLVETSRRLMHQLGINSSVVVCAPNAVPENLTPYDCLIVGWGAYTHIPGTACRVAFLRKLRAVLPPGAPMFASFWARVETSPDEARVIRLANRLRSLRGAPLLEMGDHLTSRGYHHCFTKAEVEAEFKAGGFRMCHFADSEGHPYAVGLAD